MLVLRGGAVGAVCFVLMACGQEGEPAEASLAPTSAADMEIGEAIDAATALARAVAEPDLFAVLARPSGPLNLTFGNADDLAHR